jgi:hypothetical protein
LLRLGPALLTALLSGVPRPLAPRPSGEPSPFVEVVRSDPDLEAFGEALAAAVERCGIHLARQPLGATAVIRVHGVTRCPATGREIVSLSLGDAGDRPLMLHYAAEHRVAAAATLLRTLTNLAPRAAPS